MINASRFFLFLVAVVLFAGCALFETTTYSPDDAPIRIVITPTPFFRLGPLQERADEYLPTGTVVQIARKSLGYSLVRKENGVTGYVPNENLAETNRPFGLFSHYDADFLIPDLPDSYEPLALPQDNPQPLVSQNPPKEISETSPAPSKKTVRETPIESEPSPTSAESRPSFVTRYYRSVTNLWPWSGRDSSEMPSEKSSEVNPSTEPTKSSKENT